jgi:hypothetical protein
VTSPACLPLEGVVTVLQPAILPADRWRERLHHRFLLLPDGAQIAMPGNISIDFDSTQCYITIWQMLKNPRGRSKTAWFPKGAFKARIKGGELSKAIQEVMDGQADDLCGGVFKSA